MKKIPADKKFLQNIAVIDIAEEGKGVGKSDDLVIFIDKAVPGDIVDVELLRRKKKFYEGKIQNLIKPSDHRTEPFCDHFGPKKRDFFEKKFCPKSLLKHPRRVWYPQKPTICPLGTPMVSHFGHFVTILGHCGPKKRDFFKHIFFAPNHF